MLKENFNPIIIGTARTGSHMISIKLYDLLKQISNYANNLFEYFSIGERYQSIYNIVDDVLVFQRSIEHRIPAKWYTSVSEEINDRIKLLKSRPEIYLIKVFPFSIESNENLMDFILNKYNAIIYLERRDKIKQILSASAMFENKSTHYWPSEQKNILTNFYYRKKHVSFMLKDILMFKTIKNKYSGIDLYYEDFVNSGKSELDLCKLLKLNYDNISYSGFNTYIKTPYPYDVEKMIINDTQWQHDKPYIIKSLETNDISHYLNNACVTF